MRGWRFRVAEADSVACICTSLAIAEKEKKHYPVNESARGFMDSECRKRGRKEKSGEEVLSSAFEIYPKGVDCCCCCCRGWREREKSKRQIDTYKGSYQN
jgi:hypothetical protein